MPEVSLSLQALVDQAEASVRDWLDRFPGFGQDVRENPRSSIAARTVAVDCLAVIQEAGPGASVEDRLNLVTARLLAWDHICDFGERA